MQDQCHGSLYATFKARVQESGCRCSLLPPFHRRIGGFWHDDWVQHRKALEAALSDIPKPVAILAANDAVAAEIVQICHQLNFAIPQEVAVLGMGNDAVICESAAVPLSSVQQDVESMAYVAAERLHRIVSGGMDDLVRQLMPHGSIVTRISTDACAVANTQVAQALGYIAEHYHEARLNVAEIADVLRISRRHFERVFRQQVGCSVSDHILRRRMQEASRLLKAHARARIAEIAGLVGFSDPRTFFRAFRRHFGHSPSDHRRVDACDLTATESLRRRGNRIQKTEARFPSVLIPTDLPRRSIDARTVARPVPSPS